MHYGYVKLLLLLLCGLSYVACNEQRIVLCGDKVPDVLASVCEGNYNSKMKRNYDAAPELDSSYLLRRLLGDSIQFQLKTRRRKRYGIKEECCLKSCTQTELSAYCQADQ
ncbi:probable insulin-like peptide 3 isoform X2 [Drosophila busckii]|uniref:probable insulin-like peptide 3 isoform X2 n=1 Tax=Drosophila busckii TaxID=30019 RepID=UPI00083F36E1|nr:probable insulin-like peptide 3 isoform X2 [Drosophila busckii]